MLYSAPPHYYQSKKYTDYAAYCGFNSKIFPQEGNPVFVLFKRIPLLGIIAKIPKVNLNIKTLQSILKWAKTNKIQILNLDPAWGRIVNTFNTKRDNSIMDNLLAVKESPPKYLLQLGFVQPCSYYYESRTRLIKIPLQGTSLLNQIPRRSLRTQINKAIKNQLTVSISQNIEIFLDFFVDNNKRRGHLRFLNIAQLKAFWDIFSKGQQAKSYLIFVKDAAGELQAAVLLVVHGQTAYYRLAAMSAKGEKLQAAKLAAFSAIEFAQSKNCTLFDFGGIVDPVRTDQKNWRGFSYFKEGFGGGIFQYEQPWGWYPENIKGKLFKLLKL